MEQKTMQISVIKNSSIEKDGNEQLNYYAVKSNASVQDAYYDLSLIEQKILLFLISKIKQDDTEFHMFLFDISLFLKISGKTICGKNYQNVKMAVENLYRKEISIDTGFCLLTEPFIDRPIWDNEKGNVVVKLNSNLSAYYLQLKTSYTQYKIKHMMRFESKYAIRIYEIAKSYEYRKNASLDIEKLKKQLKCEDYVNWSTFEKKVLLVAVEQINKYSDLHLSYNVASRVKKRVKKISLTIKNVEKQKEKEYEEFKKCFEKAGHLLTKIS